MPRRSNGQVLTRKTKRGTVYALRFYAGGERHYVTLGAAEDGWNQRRAEDELAAAMAAVRAGTWSPPKPTAAVERARPVPTFHEFASEWFERHRREWRPNTISDYRWSLTYHLLPHFADFKLSAITVAEVDRFKAAKARRGTAGAEPDQQVPDAARSDPWRSRRVRADRPQPCEWAPAPRQGIPGRADMG